MLKYLIILLNDNAVSYCHYDANIGPDTSISPEILSKAIFWAMKENLSVQFVYSNENLSNELKELIDSIDHVDIVPSSYGDKKQLAKAGIVVLNNWKESDTLQYSVGQSYVIRTTFDNLLANQTRLVSLLKKVDRINIMITDTENFVDGKTEPYKDFLNSISPSIIDEYKKGHMVQFNLLTDRIMLKEMNNCNAGHETITLSPNGKFYICPAFYVNNGKSVGNIDEGIDIINQQLYKLDHAPICRICDAFHCKRCIWYNKLLCHEVNTPSHQQCIMAHIERKASQKLLAELRQIDPTFQSEVNIPDLEYIDPFDKITK